MKEYDQDFQALVLRLEVILEKLAGELAVDESELSYLASRVYNFTVVHATVPLQMTQAKALNILASAPEHPVLHDLKYMAKGASQMYARLTSPLTNLSRDPDNVRLGVEVSHAKTVVQGPHQMFEDAALEDEPETLSSGVGFQRPSSEW
jgi:hypothetical protein